MYSFFENVTTAPIPIQQLKGLARSKSNAEKLKMANYLKCIVLIEYSNLENFLIV